MSMSTFNINNIELYGSGEKLLEEAFAPYICKRLEAKYGAEWWDNAIVNVLRDNWSYVHYSYGPLPPAGRPKDDLIGSLDIRCCLTLLIFHWKDIFQDVISPNCLTSASSLTNFIEKDLIDDYDIHMALSDLAILCEQIDTSTAEKMQKIRGEFEG